MLEVNGNRQADGCSCCNADVDARSSLQVKPPCGHNHHYTCLKNKALKGCVLSCEVCGACGSDFINGGDLLFLYEECAPTFRRWQSELELQISTELTLRRPVALLTVVPEIIWSLEGLRTLSLTGFPITALSPAIGKLKSLKRLELTSLYLQELPDEVCELQRLERLTICGCNVQALPSRIGTMQNLRSSSLDCNMLSSLPDQLPPMLEGLMVPGNCLQRLPEHLGECSNVEHVLAHANQLTSLPESICHLSRLRNISLHGNRLKSLPEAFGQLRSTQTLMLSDNFLESLPDGVGDLVRMEWLFVYNNRLKKLPERLLQRAHCLQRVLVEANPLSEETMADLFTDVPDHIRVLGVDEVQTKTWCDRNPLPKSVVSGRMLPWGRLYAKLMSSSQISRQEQQSPAIDAPSADTLVVAFSASQGEPEWLGVLAQIAKGECPLSDANRRISRHSQRSFKELLAQVHDMSWTHDADSACKRLSTLWHDFCTMDVPPYQKSRKGESSGLENFDVLSLCDTNAQWYLDTESNSLGLNQKLQELRKGYKRVLFLGVSMGGFAALNFSHLADSVVVFGPQVDLCQSHLRPGMHASKLAAASVQLKSNVQQAISQGARIEYHVSMDDHLIYARRLLLPPGALVVHPLRGRIARLLERASILVPLIVDLIGELQGRENVSWPVSSGATFTPCSLGPDIWDWSDDREATILVSKWGVAGELCFFRTTPKEVSYMCLDPPEVGDWYCNVCRSHNFERHTFCPKCKTGLQTKSKVARQAWDARCGYEQYRCMQCSKLHRWRVPNCESCGGELGRVCEYCKWPSLTANGRIEPREQKWYCNGCWAKFSQQNAAMKEQLSKQWYVEGGQAWSWREGKVDGYIEFDRHGALHSSWGRGSWVRSGSAMDVSFGDGRNTRKLVRVPAGYMSLNDGDEEDFLHGRPLNGAPSPMDMTDDMEVD